LVAFGGAILQSLATVLCQDLAAGFFETLDRENVWRGKSPTEGDDLWLLRDF